MPYCPTLPCRAAAALALLTTALLAACGGGGTSDPVPIDPTPTSPGTTRLYIGYYAEDATNNPEDPTVGALFLQLPSGNGAFSGLMPFSYAGCSSGVDTGAVNGTRTGSSLTGSWQGTLDGQAVGGAYAGSLDSTADRFTGSYTNAAGKQAVALTGCSYYVAATGRFTVYGAAASEPSTFTLDASSSTVPTLSWTALSGVGAYTLRLFDRACLLSTPTAAACFLGEASTTLRSLAYPTAFFNAVPLQLGRTYIAVLTAQRSDGTFLGFASREFTPSTEPSTGGGGGGGSTAPAGTLTAVTSTGTVNFTPSALGTLQTSGPSCTGSGSRLSCVSGLTLTWNELLPTAVGTRGLAVTLSSTSATAPGAQPGVGVTEVTANYAQGPSPATQYLRACGALYAVLGCASTATLGITFDSTARTLSFNNTTLPATAPATGNVVLNGTLRY